MTSLNIEGIFRRASLVHGLVLLISAICFFACVFSAAQNSPAILDDSDWWSRLVLYNHLDLGAPSTNLQHREPAPFNFQIGGVTLAPGVSKMLPARFGKATQVQRGDASSSRRQTCYVSTVDGRNVYLIFEQDGEGFGSSFYLFEDGMTWAGRNLCVQSPRVSASVKTRSGLHLGETPSEVQSILGKPSTASSDKLVYVYEVQRNATAGGLEKMRRTHPGLSDTELRNSFGTYYFDAYIEARFAKSRLTYLAVAESESYP